MRWDWTSGRYTCMLKLPKAYYLLCALISINLVSNVIVAMFIIHEQN